MEVQDNENTFYFNNGSCIRKHKNYLEFAHGIDPENGTVLIEEGAEFFVDVREVGGKDALHVSIDQSPEEFIAALERTELFTQEDHEARKLGAHWTRVYSTRADGEFGGALIKHTPMYFQIRGQKFHTYGYPLPDMEANCFKLSKPPVLHYLQTEELFTQALIESGAYDPTDEETKRKASPWTKKFVLTDGTVIKRTPTYIDIADESAEETVRGWESQDWRGALLLTPLILNLSQTEEEFGKALQVCGLLRTKGR
jgi:hypothetical protein